MTHKAMMSIPFAFIDTANWKIAAEGEGGTPVITTDQAEAYKDACVREALAWQPIETAPKDGVKVILAWGGQVISGLYLDNSRTSMPWAGWRTESMVPAPAGQPAHWMPLPPPPAK